MIEFDYLVFVKNLRVAIAWTNELSRQFDSEKGTHGFVFRKTNPIINGLPLFNYDMDYVTWNLDPYDVAVYKVALEEAISKRILPEKHTKVHPNGRILCFSIGFTTNDGIATRRFFTKTK